jgi:hypothetical protein
MVNDNQVFDFYTQTSRTAQEIHEEAKRIAEAKKAHPAPQTTHPEPSSDVATAMDGHVVGAAVGPSGVHPSV